MHHPGLLTLFLVVATSTAAAAAPTDFLPPARPWSGASEALIVSTNHPWITPAERTGLTDTPSYDETLAWLRKLAAASPLVRVVTFGHTALGQELCAVIASREGIADVAQLPGTDRPTVLVQAAFTRAKLTAKTPA